jgi:hypothetical protein
MKDVGAPELLRFGDKPVITLQLWGPTITLHKVMREDRNPGEAFHKMNGVNRTTRSAAVAYYTT